MRNLKLSITQILRYWLNITQEGPGPDLSGYGLKARLGKENTHLGFPWFHKPSGHYLPYHPEQTWQYHDPSCVDWRDDQLKLRVIHEPRVFQDPELGEVKSHYARGIVESDDSWLYGYFEYEILLPDGIGQWPAGWLTGVETWPCEIDNGEFYSRNDRYKGLKKLQSNIHYLDNGAYKKLGAKDHPLPTWFSGRFFKVGTLWDKDKIEWYYNGYLVRVLKDRKVLKALEEPQTLILNSGVQSQFPASSSITIFKSINVYQKT